MTSPQNDPNVVPLTAKFSSSVVPVDPDTARRWLGNNTHNRSLRQVDVAKYARDMRAGKWDLNGEAIKFANDGTLLDGQHRLHAVVKADATVLMLVVRGVAPQAQSSMDTGTKRTASDVLSLAGNKNTSLLAASIRNAITVREVGYAQLGRYSVTHAEVVDFFREHPEMEIAVDLARSVSRDIDCPPAIVAYALWTLMRLDAQAAVGFFRDAASRVGLEAGDPVLAMGKRFAEARRNRERLPHAVYLSIIYRCWNARRAGKPMRLAKVNSPKGGVIDVPEPK